jgi:PAS domain S-box-containing protein
MSIPEQPPEFPAEPTAQQVEEILSSPELVRAVENDEFKVFLDHIPVGIAVARNGDGTHRIVYANQMFESLSGLALESMKGSGWSALDGFASEDDVTLTLGAAITAGEDFLGTFRKGPDGQAARTVQGYVGVIENEDGTENYRIAALVDVSERERSQRVQLELDLRSKDLLLKELQHRVKNNLQLVVALIRLESRNLKRGDPVDFDRLAGRIDALAALYQALEIEPNAQQVDLGGFLSQIASTVARAQSDGSIALELKVSFCPASVNVALPAGLLLNELLTNSLKYAFVGRDKGTVVLECLRLADDRYRIVVADDGVGLPAGLNWPVPGKLSALILQTLRENTRQTEFKIDTVPGGGTRVSIEFVHHAPAPKAN